MDKILEVKDLKISFRTSGGTLKAVRDISFDLERGKTLAIVGESGSGKSVTSKAILGILAGNSIVEGGEILYDGKDLLKIDEEEMYKLRGDKISMIFQDPLSSLNPIVKIGRQITEAMLLKNKAKRREARTEFNSFLEILRQNMTAAMGPASAAEVKRMTETFDRFCIEANHLENHYNLSDSKADDLENALQDFLFLAEKGQKTDVRGTLREYLHRIQKIDDPFYTARYGDRLSSCADNLQKALAAYQPEKDKKGKAASLPQEITAALKDLETLLEEMKAQERPNFFRIGYYKMVHPEENLHRRPIEELNAVALDCLNENFMDNFLKVEEKGVRYSHEKALEAKKNLLAELEAARVFFEGEFDKASAGKLCKTLSAQVEESIDRLEIVKDSTAYTFHGSLKSAIDKYFYYKGHNPKEEARYARQSKKLEAMTARGRTVDWKVMPKRVYDLEDLRKDIIQVIQRLEEHYRSYIAAPEKDFRQRSIAIVDHLKSKASDVVYRVTKSMAREKAIKLMDEVGISEPRMRYKQYPFEFSGGMRQRIVIAIALAADPEILICDEPTTALDVTIQAQILELINRLKEERNLSVIFITHDLGVVANMADQIAVMYAGKIVEYGSAEDIFYDPRHPYTWALLSSMPDLDTNEKLDAIPGTPPNMIYPPEGDAFAPRNKYALKIDFEQQPPLFEVSQGHWAATWLLHPDAPKVDVPVIITNRIERMKAKLRENDKEEGGGQNGE
ncbi:oligopeptide transport ATP-binding protein OppD [Lachnospiraceae bacterium]|nr:oligopeptide transport ATP-binding protein OppD [Lachnospiraceae bacterium]